MHKYFHSPVSKPAIKKIPAALNAMHEAVLLMNMSILPLE
jgi:hypothetical protein